MLVQRNIVGPPVRGTQTHQNNETFVIKTIPMSQKKSNMESHEFVQNELSATARKPRSLKLCALIFLK